MKIINTVLLCVGYVVIGVTFEEYDIIVQPSSWAFYGAVFGVLVSINALKGK